VLHDLIQNIDRNIPISFFGRNAGKLHLVKSSFVNYPWKWKIILRSSKDMWLQLLQPTHKTRLYHRGAAFCKKMREKLSNRP